MSRLSGAGDDYWSAETLRVKYDLPWNVESVDKDQEAIQLLRKRA